MSKPVLGLIGAIGAGKSTATRLLRGLGGAVVDCDALGHQALELPEVNCQLTERWGSAILNSENRVDRRMVAQKVFADLREREFLEAVVFPVIRTMATGQLQAAEQNAASHFAVLDAALLLEAGWHDACNRVLYIDAPYRLRLDRLQSRSGWSAADLEARESAQWPSERKQALSDALVVNDGSLAELGAALTETLTGWGWLPENLKGASHA